MRTLPVDLATGADADVADWLSLLELTALYDQHLSDDEVLALRSPVASTSQAIEADRRPELVLEVAQCMRENVSPSGRQARELAWRWVDMVVTLTSNNAVLAGKLRRLQEENRRAQDIVGIDAAMLQWIDQAIVHARVHLFGEYLTPEQTARLLRLQLAHGNGWPALVAKVRAQMDAGVPHDAEPMRAPAPPRLEPFLDSYCGGDADLGERVRYALNHEPRLSARASASTTHRCTTCTRRLLSRRLKRLNCHHEGSTMPAVNSNASPTTHSAVLHISRYPRAIPTRTGSSIFSDRRLRAGHQVRPRWSDSRALPGYLVCEIPERWLHVDGHLPSTGARTVAPSLPSSRCEPIQRSQGVRKWPGWGDADGSRGRVVWHMD